MWRLASDKISLTQTMSMESERSLCEHTLTADNIFKVVHVILKSIIHSQFLRLNWQLAKIGYNKSHNVQTFANVVEPFFTPRAKHTGIFVFYFTPFFDHAHQIITQSVTVSHSLWRRLEAIDLPERSTSFIIRYNILVYWHCHLSFCGNNRCQNDVLNKLAGRSRALFLM